jgi:hypothetical protein
MRRQSLRSVVLAALLLAFWAFILGLLVERVRVAGIRIDTKWLGFALVALPILAVNELRRRQGMYRGIVADVAALVGVLFVVGSLANDWPTAVLFAATAAFLASALVRLLSDETSPLLDLQ